VSITSELLQVPADIFGSVVRRVQPPWLFKIWVGAGFLSCYT
jgi:hypothetical protein